MKGVPGEKIKGVPSLFSLKDRVAVITGGSKGLGQGIGLAFAAAGAHVVPVSRTLEDLEAVSEEIRSLGRRSIPVVADVTLDEPVEAMVRRVMEVNFFGAVNCTKAALPSLLERRGRIVVLSSVAGFAPLATRTGYSASKHALHGFFESLRAEHLQDGLGVTMVCPYFVNTAIGAHALGPHGEPAGEGQRTGVRGAIEPEQVADAILRGVRRGQDRVLVPSQARLAWWISRLAPSLYERLMARRVRN